MDCVDFDALEEQARAKLPAASYAFGITGADDEISAAENIAAWRNLRLRPHVLNDISQVDTSTTLLGAHVGSPICVAPTGRHMMFHPQGEVESARGATMAKVVYGMATNANRTVEDVAAAGGGSPQWFQLYMWEKRDEVEALLDRVVAAGFKAIFLTVDSPVSGWSPRSFREPHLADDKIRSANRPGQPVTLTAYDPSFKGVLQYPVTWRDLEWLAKRVSVPVIVKGVLRGDDAARCIDHGAKAVLVSNHGGRHLDTTVTTCAALPEVVDAVGKNGEVYVDSGIRRGTDILKALALGARAVLIGRPVLWGLSVNGAQGVTDVMEHLREELIRAMQLCGVAKLSDIKPDLVAR